MLPVGLIDFLRVARHQGVVNAAGLCSPDRRDSHLTLRPRGASVAGVRQPDAGAPAVNARMHPLRLSRQSADREVFRQVFVNWVYRNPVAEELPPRVIVDVGAHIGIASVFFASRFPAAKVVAVEPDEDNFRLLVENTRLYGNIVPLHAALWYEDSQLYVEASEEGSWASRVNTEGRGKPVQGLTLKTLLASQGLEKVDILKLDVEGAEKEIFERDPQVLVNVRALYVELHDYLVPGCARAVYGLASKYNFSKYQNGEVDILIFSDRR